MRRVAGLALAATTALALTACGSSTPPPPATSAPKACADFRAWQAASGGDVTSQAGIDYLFSAAKAAPPGLFTDMDTLRLDMLVSSGMKSSYIGQNFSGQSAVYVQVVKLDCLNVHGS